MKLLQPRITAIAFAVATLGGVSVPSCAQGESALEEIVTIGTRRASRSAADTPAPVDVIGANDILDQATSDISDLIRTVVPSYQVNTQPISDAATLVRPANLRGLSPDNTLVLLNGKHKDQQQSKPEGGDGDADQDQECQNPVGPPVLSDGRHHPRQQAEHRTDDQRGPGQHQGCGKTLEDLVDYRPVEIVGAAKVALQEIGKPDEVLLDQAAVQAELGLELCDIFGRGVGAKNGQCRIARNGRHDDKNDHRQPEKDGHRGDQTFQDVDVHADPDGRRKME